MNFAVGKVSELRRALTLPPQTERERERERERGILHLGLNKLKLI